MESRGKKIVSLVTGDGLVSPQKCSDAITKDNSKIPPHDPELLANDSDRSDSTCDDTDKDPNFTTTSSSCSSSSSSSSTSSSDDDDCNNNKSISGVTHEPVINKTGTTHLNAPDIQLRNNQKKRKRNPSCTPEIIKTRRRIRRETNWIKVKAKFLRNTGQEYTSTGKNKRIIPAKCVQERCGDKCRFKCHEITDDDRKNIFDEYYKLHDINRKRDYINAHIKLVEPKYRYVRNHNKPRKLNNAYYFTIKEGKLRVCKHFFKATLHINDRVINTVIKKKKKTKLVLSKKTKGENMGNTVKLQTT